MLSCAVLLRASWKKLQNDGGEGGIDSLAALVHPCGARFARPNRRAGLSNPVVYFEGSNVELLCVFEGFLEETTN